MCGSDNVTYSNSCKAKSNRIIEYTEGKCKKNCNCPLLFAPEPTCGLDNKTYGSRCEAKCRSKGIKYNGPCNKPQFCIEIYKPVCGSDNVTYSNSCKAGLNGITKYTEGKCKPIIIKPEICSF